MKSLVILVVATVLLTLSCKDAVAPFESEYSLKEGKKLFIVDGFYKQVSTYSGEHFKYFYEFSYFSLEECRLGGYGLKYDSVDGAWLWYVAQTLQPNKLYHISDTIRMDKKLFKHPVVTLLGYKEYNGKVDSSFHARYTLQLTN